MWAYQVIVPMQGRTAREMATQLDHIDTRQDFNMFTLVENSFAICILAVQPLLIFISEVHRAIEHACPLQMGAVEVRMGNGNGFETSSGLDELNGSFVEKTNTVPEDVTGFSLDEEGALADGELRTREDGPDTAVNGVLLDLVGVSALHLG